MKIKPEPILKGRYAILKLKLVFSMEGDDVYPYNDTGPRITYANTDALGKTNEYVLYPASEEELMTAVSDWQFRISLQDNGDADGEVRVVKYDHHYEMEMDRDSAEKLWMRYVRKHWRPDEPLV